MPQECDNVNVNHESNVMPVNPRNRPKQGTRTYKKKRPNTEQETNALIRHHLEEASTHLGAVKQLIHRMPHANTNERLIEEMEGLIPVGKFLKKLYVRHGGHPDA